MRQLFIFLDIILDIIIKVYPHIMYGINICGGNINLGHNKLYRNFIILQEDERGHSTNDKVLSGYAKVEAKGDKCKISFYAQNLKSDDKYSMVLICCKRDFKELVDIGPLNINEGGKADTSKEYYVNNIAGLGISYEKISGAAICKTTSNEAEFIMHGFMNGEEPAENWRKFKLVKVQNIKESLNVPQRKENISQKLVPEKNESISNNIEEKVEENILPDEDRNKCKENKKECKDKDNDKKEKCKKEEYKKEEEKKEEHKKCDKEDKETEGKKDCVSDLIDKAWDKMEYCTHIINMDIKDMEYEYEVYGFIKIKNVDKCQWKKFKIEKSKPKECKSKRIEENTKLDLNLDTPDFDDYEKKIDQVSKTDYIGMSRSLDSYFENIVRDFEPYNENFKDINNCRWYKVNVNSIDDLCDESDHNKYTLAYYPMINYYPYINKEKHFLLGYKCDSQGELKYIVYGIPGSKAKEEQPYGGKTGFVTWTTNNDVRSKGYWFMFYDYKNSSIAVPMKK